MKKALFLILPILALTACNPSESSLTAYRGQKFYQFLTGTRWNAETKQNEEFKEFYKSDYSYYIFTEKGIQYPDPENGYALKLDENYMVGDRTYIKIDGYYTSRFDFLTNDVCLYEDSYVSSSSSSRSYYKLCTESYAKSNGFTFKESMNS